MGDAWQPIETAPRDGVLMLIYWSDGEVSVTRTSSARALFFLAQVGAGRY